MLLSTLVSHLDALLDPRRMHDYCPNGLQVEGRAEVRRLASACTASLEVCAAAAARGCDALFVHHGILWGKDLRLTGMLGRRVATLMAAQCSLLGYHLPLDAHAEVGNNAVLLDLLGARRVRSFAEHHGTSIGWVGELAQAEPAAAFAARLATIVNHAVLHCPGDGRAIRLIGAVTGGGGGHLLDAARAGCDALVTGEVNEAQWHEAAETGCHAFAAGHHATESIAIHRLAAQIAADHGLAHERIEITTPL